MDGLDKRVVGQKGALLGTPIHNLHVPCLNQGSIRQPACHGPLSSECVTCRNDWQASDRVRSIQQKCTKLQDST